MKRRLKERFGGTVSRVNQSRAIEFSKKIQAIRQKKQARFESRNNIILDNERQNNESKKQKHKEWYLENKERLNYVRRNSYSEKFITNQMKTRLRHPERYKARYLARSALYSGKLIKQPCEACGVIENVQAHHGDYSKPLDVMWLCVEHHSELHAKINTETRKKRINQIETVRKEVCNAQR